MVPLEGLHNLYDRRGGFHIRPCKLHQGMKMIGHNHKIMAMNRRILADNGPEGTRNHAGGYRIRPYIFPVWTEEHFASLCANGDEIGTVLAVIVILQMMQATLWQFVSHHFNPKFSNKLLKWGL